jgi:TatD DNase family protein
MIDSHAHLTDDRLFFDLDSILKRAQQAGICAIINICTDLITLERGLQVHSHYPWVHLTAATTPHDVEKEGETHFLSIAHYARQGFLQGIGETGLDYYYPHSDRSIQQHFLRRYLQLALECQLPVIIHCREAFQDLFSILDGEYRIDQYHAPGVLHCFTGTMKEAEQVIKRGWFLSLSGILTFKKSTELQEVAKHIPLSHLLIETDAPYLSPQPYRGKINEPAYLIETASYLASIKEVSIQEVIEVTTQNTRQLFNI